MCLRASVAKQANKYIVIFHLVPKISLESAELKVYESEAYVSVCVELKSNLKRDVHVALEVYGTDATRK